MQVKFKKLSESAIIPSYAKPGDGALDITATSKEFDKATGKVLFGTGLAVEIPEGYVGLLFPRSSIIKQPLSLANSVGVIDSGFRGEIKFYFNIIDRPRKNYEPGDRIGQMIIMPHPKIEPVEVTELSSTDRGAGSFGSTGA